jgi:hypothetical protein
MDWIHLEQDSSRGQDNLSNSVNGREFLEPRNCQFPEKRSAALCCRIQVATRHAYAVGPDVPKWSGSTLLVRAGLCYVSHQRGGA